MLAFCPWIILLFFEKHAINLFFCHALLRMDFQRTLYRPKFSNIRNGPKL